MVLVVTYVCIGVCIGVCVGLGDYAYSFLYYAMPAVPGKEAVLCSQYAKEAVLCSHYVMAFYL